MDRRAAAALARAAHHRKYMRRIALGIKRCPGCRRWLDMWADFGPAPSQFDGRRTRCYECHRAAQRDVYARKMAARRAAVYHPALPAPERPCCYGDGNGSHDESCILGAVAS